MTKFFNEEMDEVEAFTQTELDKKLKEAETKFKESNPDNSKDLEKVTKDLESKTTELQEAKDRGDRLEGSYKEARTKLSEYDKAQKTAEADKQTNYAEMVKKTIEEQSGNDKEMAEALSERYEGRNYEATTDTTELNKRMGEELLLTQNQLNREIKPFNPATTEGKAPVSTPEITEGKVSDDVVADALNLIGVEVEETR